MRRTLTRQLLRARLRLALLTPRHAGRLRLAALKVARPAMADSLHDEHQHLAAPGAAHPHMASLYRARFPDAAPRDLGLAKLRDGRPALYLGLAYEAGAPLSALLARRADQRPAPRWSATVAAQLASALAHLHGRGIVHHDLRPANIIVRPGPHAVLIDLGAAETPGAPRRRAVYGAAGWLPPERCGDSLAPASPQVDVYALGRLLLALTAGSGVPVALAELIAQASAPDVERRRAAIPTMGALLRRLQALLADESLWLERNALCA